MQPMSVLLICNDKYEFFFFPNRIGSASRIVPARRSGSAGEVRLLYIYNYSNCTFGQLPRQNRICWGSYPKVQLLYIYICRNCTFGQNRFCLQNRICRQNRICWQNRICRNNRICQNNRICRGSYPKVQLLYTYG